MALMGGVCAASVRPALGVFWALVWALKAKHVENIPDKFSVRACGCERDARADFQKRQAQCRECGFGQSAFFRDRLAHGELKPLRRRVQKAAHLIGIGRRAGGTVAFQSGFGSLIRFSAFPLAQ
jgi:ribosomal protein L37E